MAILLFDDPIRLDGERFHVTEEISVLWSLPKRRPFTPIQQYIGFDWDLNSKSVTLPIEKLSSVQQLISHWLEDHARLLAHEAASLHGKWVRISWIFPLICPFLCPISHFELTFVSTRVSLHPMSSVHADPSWIKFLPHNMSNLSPLYTSKLIDINWWGDASTSFGIGIVMGITGPSGNGAPNKLSTLVGQKPSPLNSVYKLQSSMDCFSSGHQTASLFVQTTQVLSLS